MTNGIALKIYESNVASDGENIITGLHYKRQKNENPILTNDLTTCVRLNLKRLGNYRNPAYSNNPTPLIIIPSSNETYFLAILAGYPVSFIHLNGKNLYLHDQVSNSNLIWKLHEWHHICFSYSMKNSQIRFVKVSSTNYITAQSNSLNHRSNYLTYGLYCHQRKYNSMIAGFRLLV